MDTLSTVIDTTKQLAENAVANVTDTVQTVVDTVAASPVVTETVNAVAGVASNSDSLTLISLTKNLASSLTHTKASLEFEMLFAIIGGLAIFLLGMNHMSSGLQTVAGPKLRTLIGAVTNNRIMAAFLGVIVTTIVQSSSVTTVMVVGFVNSGIMTLTQALGVIFGANIGTTITGWIIALKIGKYGLPLLAVSAIIYLFSKKDRVKYTAMALMGIGMIFFGLELMKHGFKPVSKDPSFKYFFELFQFDLANGFTFITYLSVLKCVAIGAILTAIVQSSSATLGITITLALTGAINFPTAAALVMGQNIGTTITAFLASLNTNTAAKRAAYGHMMFNIFGVLWITAIFGAYVGAIDGIFEKFSDVLSGMFGKGKHGSENLAVKIAMVHTGFNVVNTVLFVAIIPAIAKLLYKLVPDKKFKEKAHLTSLGTITMHESPALAIEEAKLEVDLMGDKLTKMSTGLFELIKKGEYDEQEVKKLFEAEETLDIYQAEVSEFLMDLLATKELSHESAEMIQRLFRFADEYESISDYLTGVLKRILKLREEEIQLGNEELDDILELHEKMEEFMHRVVKSVELCRFDTDAKLAIEADTVKISFKEKRRAHLTRLSENALPPLLSVSYMDILTNYRKVNDHLTNISEVIVK